MGKSNYVIMLLMAFTLGVTPFIGSVHAAGSTSVFVAADIKMVGSEGLTGFCGVWAQINQSAEVRALWQKFQIFAIPGNYTFYYARLANASVISQNYVGRDLYILGLWTVLKITLVYDSSGTITQVVEIITDNAGGELYITGGWTSLTINIRDPNVGLITGNVYFYRVVLAGAAPIGDVSGVQTNVPDGKIDIYDLVHVARAYGNTPGIGKYDFNIDLNVDFKIDIFDLTTVAANLGTSY